LKRQTVCKASTEAKENEDLPAFNFYRMLLASNKSGILKSENNMFRLWRFK